MSHTMSVVRPAEVVVVGRVPAIDTGLRLLVQECGYDAEIVGVNDLAGRAPRVVIVGDRAALVRAAGELRPRSAVFIGVIGSPGDPKQVNGCRVHWLRSRDVIGELGEILHRMLGPVARVVPGRVELSFKEQRFVGFYVQGATGEQTAGEFGIATSTVKSHVSHVFGKYRAAGRPVHNKAQLLREMTLDGWVAPVGEDDPDFGGQEVA